MASRLGGGALFSETMPRRYQQLFRGPVVQEHAAIAVRRGSAPAHAEIWRRLPQGAAIVCLVAEDRPGLVASLATALTAQSIDILAAHVYSRSGPSGAEAVEFLWLRRDEAVAPTLLENDVARFADLLSGLLNGELRIDGRVGAERHLPSPDVATLVRVEPGEESRKPALFSLEVPARAGIFRAVHQAVLRANFQVIAHSRVGAPGGRESLRFAILDADGRAPDQYRRGLLQAEVLRILEPVDRRSVLSAERISSRVPPEFRRGFGDEPLLLPV